MPGGNKPYKRLTSASGSHKSSLGIYTRTKQHKNNVHDKDSKLSYMFIMELTWLGDSKTITQVAQSKFDEWSKHRNIKCKLINMCLKAGVRDIHKRNARDKMNYTKACKGTQHNFTMITKRQVFHLITCVGGSMRPSATKRGHIIFHSDLLMSAVETEPP
jgi:hypothetical protein